MSFYLSKMLWFLFNPFNLIIISISIGLLFSFLKFKSTKMFFYSFAFSLFFISGILPTGSFLIYILEKDFHQSLSIPNKLDGILILSGATNPYLTKQFNQVSLGSSAERLTESVKIINHMPNLKIIFSGGPAYIQYPDVNDSNSAMKFFKNMNIDTSKIIFENKSKNTFENLIFSKKIINPKKNEIWLVISSASHLKRVIGVANKIKWDLIPYATDFNQPKKYHFKISLNFLENINNFNKGSHEWLGIFYYYVTGKLDNIF